MASSLVPICTPIDGDRVLDAAWLLLPGGIAQSPTSGYRVRLGTTDADGRASWFSIFDTHTQAIPVGGVLKVTSASRLGRRLVSGATVQAEVTPYGSPTINGPLCAQVLLSSSLAVPAHRLKDAAMRDAADSLTEYSRGVGAGEQWVVKTLAEPEGHFADDAHSTTNQEVSSSSYIAGLVSLTFTKPVWARRGLVHVTGAASGTSASAAVGAFYLSVGDGTTDHNEGTAHTTATAGVYARATTYFAGTIAATTTFTLRIKIAGGGAPNIDIDWQSLAGSVVWI